MSLLLRKTLLLFVISVFLFADSGATLLGYVFERPEKKNPVKGVVVKLSSDTGRVIFSSPTGEDGSYIIKNVPKGKYRVSLIYKGEEYKAVFTRPGRFTGKGALSVEGGVLILSFALKPGKEKIALLTLGGSALVYIYQFTKKEEEVSPVK